MNEENISERKDNKTFKVNEINLSQNKCCFSVSTDKGAFGFKTDNYELFNSCLVGDISHSCLIPQSDIIIYSGAKNNEDAGPQALVFYDMKKEEMIYYMELDENIMKLSIVGHVLFVTLENKILLYSSSDFPNKIEETGNIYLSHKNHSYQIWNIPKSENSEEKVSIGFLSDKEKQLTIMSYFADDPKKEEIQDLTISYKDIQNIFYIEEFQFILIIDKSGSYFEGYDSITLEKMYTFYRGKREAQIISACGLKDDYLAVANYIYTIHLFNINCDVGISAILYSFVGNNTINSSIKIRFQDFVLKEEKEFFEKYFLEKGCILFSGNEYLKILCYSGYVYDLKIDYKKGTYVMENKKKFLEEDIDILFTVMENNKVEKKQEEEEKHASKCNVF